MEYELKLPQEDVQLVLNALAELPLKVSGGTYGRIQQLVVAQNSARTAQPISTISAAETQKLFDAAVDARDTAQPGVPK